MMDSFLTTSNILVGLIGAASALGTALIKSWVDERNAKSSSQSSVDQSIVGHWAEMAEAMKSRDEQAIKLIEEIHGLRSEIVNLKATISKLEKDLQVCIEGGHN